MSGLSRTLSYMIDTGEGYRNTYCTSGVTKLSEIIRFEMNELGNRDIIDFIGSNYLGYIPSTISDTEYLIKYTLEFIANIFKTDPNNLNGVWLTTYQDVLDKYYYKDEENNIIKVYTHKGMLPISDLDRDGALFVYVGELNTTGEECECEVRKFNLELELPEVVKLISVCNAAIVSEEEVLRNLNSCKTHKLDITTNTKNSIECIWELKTKLKKLLLEGSENN